ncbi:hypothetical protein Tco_0931534, partial [Tanacetum coccineum]
HENEDGQIRKKKYVELTEQEHLQDDCDVQATNIALQDTELSYQERECKLYNEFDKFTSVKGETLHEFYLRFAQLINDMHTIGMTMQQVQIPQCVKSKDDNPRFNKGKKYDGKWSDGACTSNQEHEDVFDLQLVKSVNKVVERGCNSWNLCRTLFEANIPEKLKSECLMIPSFILELVQVKADQANMNASSVFRDPATLLQPMGTHRIARVASLAICEAMCCGVEGVLAKGFKDSDG